ncbi:MAG: ROK family protein [bacterium]|nr:ROK family protein [bacterium]
MDYAIGVDVGGTNTVGGVVSAEGKILFRGHRFSESPSGRKRFLQILKSLVDELQKKMEGGRLKGIGFGLPGIMDQTDGTIRKSPHFPDWDDWKFRSELEPIFKTPLFFDNDANLIALGEAWTGAGRNIPDFLMMTLGTGIGGGIIIDHKVYHGTRGFAGEVGHIVVEPEGPDCCCGGKGCLEMYASATGIEWMLKEAGKKMTVEELSKLAQKGDALAVGIFKKVGFYLGIGIASLVNVLGVETVVIGGGVQKAWNFFMPVAEKEIARRVYKATAKSLKVVRASLGEDAGILGAAGQVFNDGRQSG